MKAHRGRCVERSGAAARAFQGSITSEMFLFEISDAAVYELGARLEVPLAKSSRSSSSVLKPRLAESTATPAPVAPPQ